MRICRNEAAYRDSVSNKSININKRRIINNNKSTYLFIEMKCFRSLFSKDLRTTVERC